ncbi:uncharacterized protein LOC115243257 [Formica exsecta]|uniref:uncharacterized protein LOC115243257 n=1 Tax=Formica exsecta TaxID=72781 RepID=UPI001141F338|nr:uncharacterized protein LOC115243257 [Formica exsecta]
MLSQRRRHSRWRMSLIFVAFLGLTCNGELAPANVPESSSSAPTAKRKPQDIGSLSDFSWQAWLLVDAQNNFQHGMDSATLLRRITPKSVFIAPALPACAEGYRADTMGRCVKSVNIDENAHISFLLQRLNAMYGSPQTSGNKNDQRKSSGPLQLNIPLIPSNPKPSSTKIELEETFSMKNPVVVPSRNKTQPDDEDKARPHEVAIASKYEMKNDTMLELEETTVLAENSSIDDVSKIHQKADAVVPIADFIEEANNTSFSEVVDYKIPIDLKTSLNISSVTRLNASEVTRNVPMAEKPINFTELSPTLILLIPSTKLPSIADDLPIMQNETQPRETKDSHVTVQMSNVTSNETAKEVIIVNVPESTLPSANKSAEVPLIAMDEQRDNETASESSKLNESHETEFVYDEEEEDSEYSYSTDVPDEEDSVELENEEILRHGEAGMTIPTRNIERLHRDQQQQNQTTDQKKTLEVRDQIMIRFNDSMPTEDKDEAGSNVSSEVSINGDLILETTLLDVNTEKVQLSTKSPDVIRKIIKSSDDDSKEPSDKSPNTEPEVVFSQEAHGTTFTSLHGRKRTEQLTKLDDKKNEELIAAPSSSESFLYNFPEEDPITEIRMMDKEQSIIKESALQENSKDFQLNVPANFKQTTMNLGSAEDYVRFPDYVKQPQQDSYVRFPSNEANSIHSLGYKQHSHHPIDDIGPHDSTSTKSSVPVRQKPVYYLPSWKPERLQTDHVPTSERQKQRPDLLHFWSKMPLVRDPDIYPVDQVPNDEAADDTQKLPRDRFLRASRSRKMSPSTPEILSLENVNRVPAQKRRTSIGG